MDSEPPVPLHEAMMEFKRKVVLDALAHYSGNRSRAAAALQIERTSLLRLLRELEIAEVVPAPRGRPTEGGSLPPPLRLDRRRRDRATAASPTPCRRSHIDRLLRAALDSAGHERSIRRLRHGVRSRY